MLKIVGLELSHVASALLRHPMGFAWKNLDVHCLHLTHQFVISALVLFAKLHVNHHHPGQANLVKQRRPTSKSFVIFFSWCLLLNALPKSLICLISDHLSHTSGSGCSHWILSLILAAISWPQKFLLVLLQSQQKQTKLYTILKHLLSNQCPNIIKVSSSFL